MYGFLLHAWFRTDDYLINCDYRRYDRDYAGLKKGRSFWLISHLFDTFLFMPILLIAIIIATLMEASLVNAMLAIFLAMLPHFIHKIYQATEKTTQKRVHHYLKARRCKLLVFNSRSDYS
ncbi:Peptide transport system permease protein sapC [Mannheimia haemolytica]|nr:Peptide transport system permease protein sapC [Mannheimia haemolytica]